MEHLALIEQLLLQAVDAGADGQGLLARIEITAQFRPSLHQVFVGDPGDGGYLVYNDTETLGINLFGTRVVATGSYWSSLESFEFGIPTHTSSHYQTFETPFLHELVGGDRNMEQTNLVVTPDGKSWDEVTRNVSYIGNIVVSTTDDTTTTWSDYNILTEWRGKNSARDFFNKDFAIAYDRLICLRDGHYTLYAHSYTSASSQHFAWYVNANLVAYAHDAHAAGGFIAASGEVVLSRGDYVQLRGSFGTDSISYNQCRIIRV